MGVLHGKFEPNIFTTTAACAISGGPFYYDAYHVVKGVDLIIPVDVYVPGCPPTPEALIYGILMLQDKITHETIAKPSRAAGRTDLLAARG